MSRIYVFLLFIFSFSYLFSQSLTDDYINTVKDKIRNEVGDKIILVPQYGEELEINKLVGFTDEDLIFRSSNIKSTIKILNIKYIKNIHGDIYFDYDKYIKSLLSSVRNHDEIFNSLNISGKYLKLFRKSYYSGVTLNLVGTILIVGKISTDLGIIALTSGSILLITSFYFIGEAGDYLINTYSN